MSVPARMLPRRWHAQLETTRRGVKAGSTVDVGAGLRSSHWQ